MVIEYDISITDEWEEVEIGDIAKFSSGKSRPKNTTKERSAVMNIPVYGGNGVLGYTDSCLFDSKKIILGRVGEYCGCAHITEEKSWISDNALYLKEARSECSQVFLKNCFQFLNLNQYSNKMGQPLITQSIISKVNFALPPLSEQRKIAYILTTVQEAIEKQEEIIKTTTDLKKAMMQKLFTEGLYGEPQKETEIGLVPESWKIVRIKDLVLKTITRNPLREPEKRIKYIDVSSVSNQTFSIINHQVFFGKDAPGRARKVVNTNDVIFATVRPTLKRIAKVSQGYNDEYCSTAFCVLRMDKDMLDFEFIYQYLLTDIFIKEIAKLQSGASYPAVRDDDVKNMKFPYPEIGEQKEISNILRTLDSKIIVLKYKRECLLSLFQSFLNQLMTGQMRVNNIDFPNMELD